MALVANAKHSSLLLPLLEFFLVAFIAGPCHYNWNARTKNINVIAIRVKGKYIFVAFSIFLYSPEEFWLLLHWLLVLKLWDSM